MHKTAAIVRYTVYYYSGKTPTLIKIILFRFSFERSCYLFLKSSLSVNNKIKMYKLAPCGDKLSTTFCDWQNPQARLYLNHVQCLLFLFLCSVVNSMINQILNLLYMCFVVEMGFHYRFHQVRLSFCMVWFSGAACMSWCRGASTTHSKFQKQALYIVVIPICVVWHCTKTV